MPDRASILAVLQHSVQDVIPGFPLEHIIPANSLKDLGANSLDRAEIIMLTLRTLNLKVPLMTLASAKNIGDLVMLMQHALMSSEQV